MDKLFTENEGLVKAVTNKFCVRYNCDFELAYSEACLAFVKYAPNYNGNTKFSTYMWSCIYGQLQNWQRNESKHTVLKGDVELDDFGGVAEKPLNLGNLSEVAQHAVDMVIGELADLVETTSNNPGRIRVAVQRTLQQLGYRRGEVLRAFDEIGKALSC